MDFCITGYPRSRTSWFAAFFTTGPVFCHHEIALCKPEAQYIGFSGANFAIDPPDCPTVIIERDEGEVRKSLRHLTGKADEIIDKMSLSGLEGLRVKFEDINDRLEEIWNYCVPLPFPKERATMFINLDIEPNYGYLER